MPPRRSPAPKSTHRPANPRRLMPCVPVVMASDQDRAIAAEAVEVLKEFGVAHEWRILPDVGAPERVGSFAREAQGRGVAVVIAAGGGAAHLAGAIAASTILPVIGVPVRTAALNGMDSLLSTAQTPSGVPVAGVGIDGGRNAALLAAAILALREPALSERLVAFRRRQAERAADADARLQEVGGDGASGCPRGEGRR